MSGLLQTNLCAFGFAPLYAKCIFVDKDLPLSYALAELLIWLGLFALVVALAFSCLATFAVLTGKSPEEAPLPEAAQCETAEWGHWTVCPAACGESQQVRERVITVSSWPMREHQRARHVASIAQPSSHCHLTS